MIDLDREEFLQRLDVRILAISALLATHEKYMCRDVPRKDYIEVQRSIDRLNNELIENMHGIDQKIQNCFSQLKAEMVKEMSEGV